MGQADEIWKAFTKQHPEVLAGKNSLEEINQLMAQFMQQQNTRPIDDFDGLSPEQMHFLLHEPFGEHSIIQWIANDIDEALENIPILVASDLLLSLIADQNEVKLTPKGNLPVTICKQIESKDLIPWRGKGITKGVTEDKVPYLWEIKHYLMTDGLVKKRNNKLSITAKGIKYRTLPAAQRLRQAFDFFTEGFNWQNWYGLDDNGKSGQLGWAYSLYLLAKYGSEKRDAQYYADKWLKALQPELWKQKNNSSSEPYQDFVSYVYVVRTFEHLCTYFGWVEIDRVRIPDTFSARTDVRKTSLFGKMVHVNR